MSRLHETAVTRENITRFTKNSTKSVRFFVISADALEMAANAIIDGLKIMDGMKMGDSGANVTTDHVTGNLIVTPRWMEKHVCRKKVSNNTGRNRTHSTIAFVTVRT